MQPSASFGQTDYAEQRATRAGIERTRAAAYANHVANIMEPPEASSPPERFHSPCESPDDWLGNKLSGGPTDSTTAADHCSGEVALCGSQPGERLQQYLLQQRILLESGGRRVRGEGRPGNNSEDATHMLLSDPADATVTPLRMHYSATNEPTQGESPLKPKQDDGPRSPAISQQQHDTTQTLQQQQQEQNQLSSQLAVPPQGETCFSSPPKTRSISQPRSVRDLVPRLAPSRGFSLSCDRYATKLAVLVSCT